MPKTAILLQNLGCPATDEEVSPFLKSIFTDREIIRYPLPAFLQKPLGLLIARLRTARSRQNYQRIGGSPLLQWTNAQADGLSAALSESIASEDLLILPAMRTWNPRIDAALTTAKDWGARVLVSLTMYPQYSTTTTGSSEKELHRCLSKMDWKPELHLISNWHLDPEFHKCWAWRIDRSLNSLPKTIRDQTLILYSAHGIPKTFANTGDPYPEHIAATLAGIQKLSNNKNEHRLAFQSRAGPIRWIGPHLDTTLKMLGKEACRSVLLVPISFVSDHVETLFELDIEMKKIATTAGIANFMRCPSLNADPDFLVLLAKLVQETLASPPYQSAP